jgi:predicted molibdopterin-dependent oxidoreductase YjgC
MAHQLTTCTFCGVGCGLYLETSGNQIVGAYPSVSHPSNQGRICVRGWYVHEVASSPDRLKHPLLRKNGELHKVSWDEALDFVATKMKAIRDQHGPDALGFLNSPRCSNEESFLLQKFARSVIGTNNVHHGTGVYSNNSINVLLDMIGIPASTNSIAELAQSHVIVVDGVDLAKRLPTIGGAVIRAKLNGARLIVVGTRRHRVAESADLFLQIKPGTEALLYGAIAKVIVDRGLLDLGFIKTRCRDYELFLATVREYDLLRVADACGVAPNLIEAAALAYGAASSATLMFSASMEERSRDSIRAVVNLALLSGNLGKPGAGLFALTEQNNLQGVCDMGMLPDRLPGYRPVTDDGARAALDTFWGCKVPSTPGLGSRALLVHRGQGKTKALWLSRYDPTNTALLGDVAAQLQQLDLLVVQHLFMTEASKYAHVVLPTTAFGEEEVTFTSTDRRIQLAERVVEPPVGLTPAWEQIVHLAQRMGAGWKYTSAREVMDEIGEVVPFYSGADYDNLARDYGRQWPCTKDRPLGTQYLFAENHFAKKSFAGNAAGNHEDRPFKFVAVPMPPAPKKNPKEFPLTLVFGNSLYYWNQNVLVRHSETLKREYRQLMIDYPDGFVEINPEDAKQFGIRDGKRMRLSAADAASAAPSRITAEVMAGTIFVPHFMRDVERQILGPSGDSFRLVPVRVEKETV